MCVVWHASVTCVGIRKCVALENVITQIPHTEYSMPKCDGWKWDEKHCVLCTLLYLLCYGSSSSTHTHTNSISYNENGRKQILCQLKLRKCNMTHLNIFVFVVSMYSSWAQSKYSYSTHFPRTACFSLRVCFL